MLNEFKQIKDDTFKRLKDNIGKEVTCHYYLYGVENEETSILEEVSYYGGILLGGLYIPFIGYGCAIDFIELNENHELIYNNPRAKLYGKNKQINFDEERAIVFGKDIFSKRKERSQYSEYLKKTFIDIANKKAKLQRSLFIKMGLKYVKNTTQEDWKKYVINNTADSYSACIVEATIKMLELIENDIPFDKAQDIVFKELDLTGFMSWCVANSISYFSNKGEEFTKYWNKQYGINDEETQELVNPAMLTLS